jgi:hypothetical protein
MVDGRKNGARRSMNSPLDARTAGSWFVCAMTTSWNLPMNLMDDTLPHVRADQQAGLPDSRKSAPPEV